MLPVETPFKVYTGLDGKPLDNGYVYFGIANQNPITAPVTVYWDAAGTQPAAQPLRTVNGYIMRAGTPANVFFDGAYSELVQDSKGRQVFYARTSDDFSIVSALLNFIALIASSVGASLVGFIQAGAGAVMGTLQARGRLVVYLWDYLSAAQRADVLAGTGALDCTIALQAALDHAASLYSVASGYGRGGAVLELPYGAISFTTLTRKNGVSLRGHGRYRTLLMMSQSGGTGFKSAAAASQLSADTVFWIEDQGYSLIPNPATTFSAPTILWDFTGFCRTVVRDVGLTFKGNVTSISVIGATPASLGGPAQWYNSFYDVFVEGLGGGIGWDLGDTLVAKEQITTWNWYGGRTSGSTGIGMRINGATGCNLHGHVFEGLDDELIVGSAAGTRGTDRVNLYGCFFEGSTRGYTFHPNAVSTRLSSCFATGVTNSDTGTRTIIDDDSQFTFPVANSANSYRLIQANASIKPIVFGSTAPGFRFTNDAANWLEISNGAASSAASSFILMADNSSRELFKAGTAVAQFYGTQFCIGNQSAVSHFIGAGTPEGAVTASIGSTYSRTDGGAVTSNYFKESGTGNVGWVGK